MEIECKNVEIVELKLRDLTGLTDAQLLNWHVVWDGYCLYEGKLWRFTTKRTSEPYLNITKPTVAERLNYYWRKIKNAI